MAGSPDALFAVDVLDEESLRTLKLRGECDLASVDELSDALRQAIAGGDFVVDLSELTFLDSSCLRALLEAHEQTATGPRMTLRRGPDNVMRVFDIAGVSESLVFE